MSPRKNEQELREIVRRLEQEDLQADSDLAEANARVAEAKTRKKNIQAKRRRAERPFPSDEICPHCWVDHGKISPLHAIPHEDPKHYDRWRCRACGYDDDRRIDC